MFTQQITENKGKKGGEKVARSSLDNDKDDDDDIDDSDSQDQEENSEDVSEKLV